jgi:hypothetical protein
MFTRGPPRHPGRVENRFCFHVRGNPPTDNLPGIGVDDETHAGDSRLNWLKRQMGHLELGRRG